MKILVTGGAGYIGSHTCVELLGARHDIVCLDNFSNARHDAIGRIERLAGREFPVYAVDLLDEPGVRRVFARERIEAVVHFAGLKAVGESVRIPLDYYHNNLTGTLNLCRAMAEAGCRKLVFSSSATVYGMDNKAPFREDYPLSATNPYGMTKLMIERILTDLHAAGGGWGIALLRYFNPIGAHESGLLGESPNGVPNNLLPYIMQVATGRLAELSVCGDDYGTPDGTGVRDYLHVVDLALGHVKALDWVAANSGVEAVNLGTGNGYSVLEVVSAFERASGVAIPRRIVGRRPGDIAVSYADVSKAKALLGWSAQRDLARMCADSWRFASLNAAGDGAGSAAAGGGAGGSREAGCAGGGAQSAAGCASGAVGASEVAANNGASAAGCCGAGAADTAGATGAAHGASLNAAGGGAGGSREAGCAGGGAQDAPGGGPQPKAERGAGQC